MFNLSSDNMFLLFLVEFSNSFEAQIVTLSGTASKDNFFGSCSYQISDMLKYIKVRYMYLLYLSCIVASFVSLPSKTMRSWVRISELSS